MGTKLHIDKHVSYIQSLSKDKLTYEYVATEHLRMSGIYWALCAMDLIQAMDTMPVQEIVDWVISCQHPSGGFGGNVGHDPHLLYTLSAVQILALTDSLDRIDAAKIVRYIETLQISETGAFQGDKWGEIDTRFSYCALCCLSLLGQLHNPSLKINVTKALVYVGKQCQNFDGGFGCVPGAESHAGQIFCCVATLAIGNALDYVDRERLGFWLCERQGINGGLNGRPEKLADVCYSWWVLASLSMIEKENWIDANALSQFIFQCQDEDEGGIADKPGNMADVFHTFFGIGGLSLLGDVQVAEQIDPVYALPVKTLERLGLR